MAHARETQNQPQPVGGGDDLLIAHRAPWLHDRCNPMPGSGFDPIGKRKEGVGSHDCAQTAFARLVSGHHDRIYPAHLAGPDPDCRQVFGIDDCVAFHVARSPPGKGQIGALGRSWLALADHLPASRVHILFAAVCFLNQDPAYDAAQAERAQLDPPGA